jgi:uncharacterized protein DUF6089
MKRIFVLFFCFLGFTSVNAQIHEIGVFLGGSNYIGDVGPTNYIAPNEFAYGILYKWNRSPRHSWRISYTQAKITSNDADSDVPARKQRGFDFENNIKELSLGLEFNFFDFNLHEGKRKVTPYVYTGLSYFAYEELYYVDNNASEDYQAGSLAIPMTVGIKSNITDNFVLGLEIGTRYTFTDNIDGSNPKNENLQDLKFGNTNSNDWYVFSGLTLTYTFGNKPCYCAD